MTGSQHPRSGYVYAVAWAVLATVTFADWHYRLIAPDASLGVAAASLATTVLFVYLESVSRGYVPGPTKKVMK